MSPSTRWTSLVLIVATLARLLALVAGRRSFSADPDAYRALATNLVTWGTFGTEQLPTAFRPPLYPLLLTPAVATGWDPLLIAALHLALGVGTVWLTLACGRRMWAHTPWGNLAAVSAALLVAVSPLLLRQSMLVMTETLATFLVTLALWLLIRARQVSQTSHANTSRRSLARDYALAGIAMGLLALCRPTFLLWGLLIAAGLTLESLVKRRLPVAAISYSLLVLVVLSPWIVRNWLQFDRPLVGTTHGGFTLLLANNPEFYGHLRNAPRGAVWDAEDFGRDWAILLPRNSPAEELASNERAYKAARSYMRNDVAGWARATLYRLERLWSIMPLATSHPEPIGQQLARWLISVWYTGLYLLAAVGLLLGCRRGLPAGWCEALLLLAALSAVHAFYWSDMRMRAPAEPVIALAAAAGIAQLAGRQRSLQPEST